MAKPKKVVAKKPAAKKPAAKKPAAKKPAAKKPAAKKPAAKRPAAKKTPPRPSSPAWQAVLDALVGTPGLTRRRMFGADGIGLLGKYFAMAWQGSLIVKLPRARVDALVTAGVGRHFDPSGGTMGKPMTEWLHVTDDQRDWLPLVEEGLAYMASTR